MHMAEYFAPCLSYNPTLLCLLDLSTLHVFILYSHSVVVVCLPRPMEGMGRLQFSDLFTELPVPPQVAGVVGTF